MTNEVERVAALVDALSGAMLVIGLLMVLASVLLTKYDPTQGCDNSFGCGPGCVVGLLVLVLFFGGLAMVATAGFALFLPRGVPPR